jgi:hypothetical protein
MSAVTQDDDVAGERFGGVHDLLCWMTEAVHDPEGHGVACCRG